MSHWYAVKRNRLERKAHSWYTRSTYFLILLIQDTSFDKKVNCFEFGSICDRKFTAIKTLKLAKFVYPLNGAPYAKLHSFHDVSSRAVN